MHLAQSAYPTPFFSPQPMASPALGMHAHYTMDGSAGAPSPFIGGVGGPAGGGRHSRLGSVVGGLHTPHPPAQHPHPHGHISPPRLHSYDMSGFGVNHVVGSPTVIPISPDGRSLGSMLGDLRVS